MTVKTIEASETMEWVDPGTGLKRWTKFGMTADIAEGEDEVFLTRELYARVKAAFEPPAHVQYIPTHIPGVPDSKEERIQIMINDLNQSTTLKDLESWALLTRTSHLIKEAYDKKYNELSTNKQ